jgi:hypothetical protein
MAFSLTVLIVLIGAESERWRRTITKPGFYARLCTFRFGPAGIYNGFAMNKPSDPTPVEKFFDEWRQQICPLCEFPLEMQQREPLMYFCPMCRKFFDEELKKV